MEIFLCLHLQSSKVYQEENNYICYDKSHKHLTCVLAGVTGIDMAIHWYVYIYAHVCMYMHVYLLEMSLCLKPQAQRHNMAALKMTYCFQAFSEHIRISIVKVGLIETDKLP